MVLTLSRSTLINLDFMDNGKRLVGYEGTHTLGTGSASIHDPVCLASGITSSSPSKPTVRAAGALEIFVI